MARKILWTESFEGDLTVRGYYVPALPTPNVAYGLHGKGVQVGDDHSDGCYFALADNDSTVLYFGANINMRDSVGGRDVVKFFDEGGYISSLRYEPSTEKFYLGDSSGQPIVGTEISAAVEVWHHVEMKFIYGASGTAEIRLNGGSGLVVTGVDLLDGGDGIVDSIDIAGSGSGDVNSMWIDDVVVYTGAELDDDFIGPCQVHYKTVNANGNSSDLVGSDGNSVDNYQLVDENPVDTADYVESDTDGDLDTYGVEDLSSTDFTVVGILGHFYAQRDDTNPKSMRMVARTGGVDHPGDTQVLPESWAMHRQAWDLNPDTAAAWTAAEINALEIGPEVLDS